MKKRKPYTGTIWRRGRRYYASYYVKGKQRHESFFTESEAKDFLSKVTFEKRRGRMPSATNLRMEKLFELVLTDLKNNNRRSLGDAFQRIENHLKPYFSGMKVKDFRGSDIEDYKRQRLDNVESTPAPATINRELSLLRKGFNLAFTQELIDFRISFKGRMLKERNTGTRVFSEAEFQTFRSNLKDAGVIASIDFQREVGWRMPTEVAPLMWNQIDFDEESVTLPPYSTKDEKPRVFYFTNRMREILKEQKERVNSLQKKFRKIIAHVFVNDNGMPLIETNHDKSGIKHVRLSWYFRDRWTEACEASKFYKTTHDLRRTAAVERDNAGLSRTDNMLLGGWSTTAMLDRYLQKRKQDLKSAIDKLDSFREQTITKSSQTATSGTGQSKANH